MNTKETITAMQECIDKGHDMAYSVHFLGKSYRAPTCMGGPMANRRDMYLNRKCKRCGYTTTDWATSKEKRAIKILGL